MSNEAVKFEALKKEGSTEQNGALKIVGGYKKGPKITTYNGPGNKSEVELEVGEVTTGRYEGQQVQTNPNTGDKTIEYRIREADGTLVIVKGSTALNDSQTGLAALQPNELVMLEFNGMKSTKGGRKFASFTVNRAVNADN